MKISKYLAGLAILWGGLGAANAATISPATYSASIAVGETITVEKTVTIEEGDVASKVDFYFLADNTGSMGGIINNVRTVAGSLMTTLSGSYADAAFGVGRYFGDPVEYGETAASAYDVLQTSTTDTTAVQTAINSWYASGGGDTPEANFYALQQAATDGGLTSGGLSSGEAVGWRGGSQKVVLWFGDASSHTETVTQAQAIAALNAAGVTVIALNTYGAGSGIDTGGQASAITSATGGALVNSFGSVSVANIVDTITAAVGVALGTVDISLYSDPASIPGLTISYACTDALGCTDVTAGESRTLSMTVTGDAAGVYSYDTVLAGFPTVTEADSITVGSVPEPSVLMLLSAGLIGLGWSKRSRLQA
jgi:hypothetical protein